jgi:hypothetical protein
MARSEGREVVTSGRKGWLGKETMMGEWEKTYEKESVE